MFTNWLTGTTSLSSANDSRNNENNNNNRPPNMANGNLFMNTPPDVVLEVGPGPSVRFVAHSIVLSMHSGYLRSAIRLDENTLMHGHSAALVGRDLVLYLNNVTAEQFAPLLTYMYTGYLDLNMENIFGVLLATHVLHMPRALEICRSFLARAQTEGFIPNTPLVSNATPAAMNKVIRPIPSKPSLANFGFLPLANNTAPIALANPQQHLQLPTMALMAYKNLQTQQQLQSQQPPIAATTQAPNQPRQDIPNPQNPQNRLEETKFLNNPLNISMSNMNNNSDESYLQKKSTFDVNDDEDEEVEVFIDGNTSDSDNGNESENECNISVGSNSSLCSKEGSRKAMKTNFKESNKDIQMIRNVNKEMQQYGHQHFQNQGEQQNHQNHQKNQNQQNLKSSSSATSSTNGGHRNKVLNKKREKRKNHSKHKPSSSASSSGLQIAKAPIPASQLEGFNNSNHQASKVIIDVASCDGPVRFRRILNTAYGHKPDSCSSLNQGNNNTINERSQQSLSLSFHQQMAKTISQQRHLNQQLEESENSETSNGSGKQASQHGGSDGGGSGGGANSSKQNQANNELYICVYCKHTFKSQYCYQKHAKRHLNPLNLRTANETDDKRESLNANGNQLAASITCIRNPNALPLPLVANKQNAADILKREVRPLDMNVQYYPCKTCGSKFPSYYFVHKHRKMCHADEENNSQSVAATVADNNEMERFDMSNEEQQQNDDLPIPQSKDADDKSSATEESLQLKTKAVNDNEESNSSSLTKDMV